MGTVKFREVPLTAQAQHNSQVPIVRIRHSSEGSAVGLSARSWLMLRKETSNLFFQILFTVVE